MAVTRYGFDIGYGCCDNGSIVPSDDGDYVQYEDYEPVERVALAAREFARCKHQAQGEWIEHGKVSPSTGVSLDKATDNLLTAVDAWTP